MHSRSTVVRLACAVAVAGLVVVGCSSTVQGSSQAAPAAVEQITAQKAEQDKEDKLDERYLAVLDDHSLFPGVSDELKIERGRAICERVRSGEDRPDMLKSLMNQYGISEGIMFMSDSMDVYCPEELGPK
ncbi:MULTISPECIES: DUF732 domain-containing protein [Nocardiaceae]|uniref:DUF732 domain-containing protein n=1 Tax=Nocardiaceae TaxID=85025 RepID=UPI0007AAC507|nr:MULTISPECIES: DUF732 domain-containing protein [Rhodococcus]AMY55159.1 hypothetical protein A3L23_03846 [Rhodococcus fascians D188]